MKKATVRIASVILSAALLTGMYGNIAVSAANDDYIYTSNGVSNGIVCSDQLMDSIGDSLSIFSSRQNNGIYVLSFSDNYESICSIERYKNSVIRTSEDFELRKDIMSFNKCENITETENGYSFSCNSISERNDLYSFLKKDDKVLSIEENADIVRCSAEIQSVSVKTEMTEEEFREEYQELDPEKNSEGLNGWTVYDISYKAEKESYDALKKLFESGMEYIVKYSVGSENEVISESAETVIFSNSGKEEFKKLSFEELLETNRKDYSEYMSELYAEAYDLYICANGRVSMIFPDRCYNESEGSGIRNWAEKNGKVMVFDIEKGAEYLGIPAACISETFSESAVINDNEEIVELLSFNFKNYEYNYEYAVLRALMICIDRNNSEYPYSVYHMVTANQAAGNSAIRHGDIDNSGDIDLTDLTILSQYILKDKELTDIQLISADVTNDGKADITDLALLKQYVMNDDVKLNALS